MQRLKEARQSKGFSQRDLAKKLGVNQTAVSQWERGASRPSTVTLIKICEILEVSSDYLLGVSEDESVYSWQDSEIMKEIDPSLESLCTRICESATVCTSKEKYMLFGVLFEIRHLLSSKDNNVEKREAALDLVNSVFAIATRFIDTCKSTSNTSDDIKRLEILKNDYSEQFLNQLTQFQKTFI